MKTFTSLYDRSKVPLYAQVASVMRQRVDSGFWSQGTKISTLEELEAEFGVARVTIRQAIELLRKEGLLDAQQGRGTFVSGKPKHNRWLNIANDFDTMVSLVKDNVIERVYVEENVNPPAISKDEGNLAEKYTFLRSVQYNDGMPFSVVNLFLEQNLFAQDRKKFSHAAALPKLVEMDEIEIVHAHQVLTIGVATPETAELLKIGLGEPTADCKLILVDKSGTAIYIANIHYHKDCFALRVDLMENRKQQKR